MILPRGRSTGKTRDSRLHEVVVVGCVELGLANRLRNPLDPDVPSTEYGGIRLELTTQLVGLSHTDDVDVVLLNESPPVLTYNIVATGRLFLGRALDRFRFETDAIKRFIDTIPLRERAAQAMRERISGSSVSS